MPCLYSTAFARLHHVRRGVAGPDWVRRSPWVGLVALLAACAGAAPTATVNRDDVCIPAATELAAGQRLRDQVVGFSADGRVVGGRFPAGAEAWEVMREMSVDPKQVSLVPARTRAEAAGLLAAPSTSGAVALSRGAEPAFAELFATRSGEWAVLARDGRVDGTPDAQALVYWIVGDVQLPGFVGWQRQATDRLLRLLVQRPGQVGLEGEGAEQDDRDAAEL